MPRPNPTPSLLSRSRRGSAPRGSPACLWPPSLLLLPACLHKHAELPQQASHWHGAGTATAEPLRCWQCPVAPPPPAPGGCATASRRRRGPPPPRCVPYACSPTPAPGCWPWTPAPPATSPQSAPEAPSRLATLEHFGHRHQRCLAPPPPRRRPGGALRRGGGCCPVSPAGRRCGARGRSVPRPRRPRQGRRTPCPSLPR
mmetsp:Transcript_45058/g.143552  ORF Transcript_45058/g.143552 Transcript_45058/m.143552 type:complete len:200 (+) Transcript_45058:181-780(+)